MGRFLNVQNHGPFIAMVPTIQNRNEKKATSLGCLIKKHFFLLYKTTKASRKKWPTIRNRNTILIPNVFGIQAPTVSQILSPHIVIGFDKHLNTR